MQGKTQISITNLPVIIMKFYKLFILTLLQILGICLAQTNKVEFENFKEKYNSKEFQYTITQPIQPKEDFNFEWLESLIALLRDINWNIFLYSLIGIIILIIIYKFYKNGFILQFNSPRKMEDYNDNFDYIEDNLLDINLDELINNAKVKNDYRLATRYYHYQNTQNLARKGYIKWDPKKTNLQLSNQINNSRIKKLFEHNTTIFNQIWFGNFLLDQQKFQAIETDFKKLNELL